MNERSPVGTRRCLFKDEECKWGTGECKNPYKTLVKRRIPQGRHAQPHGIHRQWGSTQDNLLNTKQQTWNRERHHITPQDPREQSLRARLKSRTEKRTTPPQTFTSRNCAHPLSTSVHLNPQNTSMGFTNSVILSFIRQELIKSTSTK